ncbi:MAG: mechanosensitive ion channel family protein [Planctomycetota bacterium]|jgi:small conductance mechanosensitive channel
MTLVGWLCVALTVTAAWGLRAAHTAPESSAVSVSAEDGCAEPAERLAAARVALSDRGPTLEERIETIASELQAPGTQPASAPGVEATADREKLVAERSAVQKELRFLESAVTAWQAALDACESNGRQREELERFLAEQERKPAEFGPAEVTALRTQLEQVESSRAALDEGEAVRNSRLRALAEQIETADEQTRSALAAERAALKAEAGETQWKRAALDAERALVEAKLETAGEEPEAVVESQPSSAPAREQEADAENKERLAKLLSAEARNRLEEVQAELERIQARLEDTSIAEREVAELGNRHQYWLRVEGYEKRRLEQADLHQRSAQEVKVIAEQLSRKEGTLEYLDQICRTGKEMSQAERDKQAERFRKQADETRTHARELEQQAEAEAKKIQPLQQLLLSLDAEEKALQERLEKGVSVDRADYGRLIEHFQQMTDLLRSEREQIDLMILMVRNIVYTRYGQASLEYELAGLYTECADVLVPPWRQRLRAFRERHEEIISSILIVLSVVGISYGVKLVIWLIRRAIAWLTPTLSLSPVRFSPKRIGTLVAFAGSIVKLFVWIFGLVMVLNEFGIDPAKSSGAIGLIGLIMAGMFQRIVIDFVSGLDIIAGGHYNVGDFIEVDGKLGYVINFTVKHTRIRTLSGHEFNLPNSRCLPSRRFPDGFVNNYVDLTVKSSADADRAAGTIEPVCGDLNQRLEPIRDEPSLAERFAGPQGRVTLRYLVRVLPGTEWVIKDYFVPAVKQALTDQGVELAGEPTFFFINRIETFRKLFNRQLTEEEILCETSGEEQAATTGEQDGTSQG